MSHFEKKTPRYAHSEGHLDLTYDETGKFILTCGPDGDVRVYNGFDDDDPVSLQVGDVAYAIAYKNSKLYAASDDNAIQAYIFDSKEQDGLITRFMAPVTHICFSDDGQKIVAGSADFSVKIVDVNTKAQKVLQGHEAPVLSVALHPDEKLLASSSCDGTVKIWEIEEQKCLHTIPGLPKNNDFGMAASLVRLTWDETGKYLVIPFETEVRVYDTTSWQISFILIDDTITENASVVRFSPCWKYLAVACRNGVIVVWDFAARQVVTRTKHDKGHGITGVCWNPAEKDQLAFCDNNGYLGLIEHVVPGSPSAPKKQNSPKPVNPLDDLFDEDEDDMLIEATNTNTGSQNEAPSIQDDSDDEVDIGALKKRFHIDEDSMDPSEAGKKDNDLDSVVSDIKPQPDLRPTTLEYQPTPLQPPFAPSSSPVHISHRFMVWNSVGIVLQYNTEEENSINVEFHDTAVHHALHVTNSLNHTMAALSMEAVLLACEADEDRPSKLVCMHFASWDNNKEWTVDMPEGEDIKAICLGDGWVAAVTDKRTVRLFTIGGVQRELFSVPGPIVTLAGHGSQLLVVYHQGLGIPGDQFLGCKLLNMSANKWTNIFTGHSLPLSPKSTLSWAGFSAEGTPFTMDSAGVVRMLARNLANTWVHMANLKKLCKGKSDNYWICGVHENPQQLRAILCKGSRYPATLPRPTVQILPYQLPVCELSTDKGTIEESFWRSKLLSHHLDWWDAQGFEVDESTKSQALMPQQESLMKMFALSCKSEREVRAVELCQLMPNYRTVQLAIKYASRLRMMQLAQRLTEIAREKAEQEEMEAQKALMRAGGYVEEEEDDPEPPRTNGISRQASARSDAQEEEQNEEEEPEVEAVDDDDEDQENQEIPALKFGSSKSGGNTPKAISTSQGIKKNPFKVASQQKNNISGKGTSVFDSMEITKPGKGKPITSPVTCKNKSISFPKSGSKKTTGIGNMFKSKDDDLRKRKRLSAEDEDQSEVSAGTEDAKGSKIAKTDENKDNKIPQDASSKLKGFAFGN